VALVARTAELNATAEEVRSRGVIALPLVADLAERASAASSVARAR
jgi:hypothetical protein